ncbi:MAG: tRNA pseudouridine(38-40) synthase TruA [Gemmatimonadaceae bacterium 4484_173]|nr:MAG: tRNA pseudouridine(38-40) synthase TruA [Gemmatimonadaceae bacterium 4484_173]RKZ03038.1 MAG: tRNA pseudouridine(38-40) synthase TruA [Candidatus Fermentibacteria bacterium]
MRLIARFEYDGTDYSGWQIQPGDTTVQGEIEKALYSLCRRHVAVTGAGRTDAGVHAASMPAHFDIAPGEYSRIQNGLNTMLPSDISCLSVQQVDDDFHARFHAVSRSYVYSIGTGRHPLNSRFEFQPGIDNLDIEAMKKAVKYSSGYNNWRGFAKEGGGNTTWDMTVSKVSVVENIRGWTLAITANRFLRGVVRIWSGTIFRIGAGRIPPEAVRSILETTDKRLAGPSLPACGLILTEVRYPHEI